MAVKNKRPGQRDGTDCPFAARPLGEDECVCVCLGLFLGCLSVSKQQEPAIQQEIERLVNCFF